MNLEPASDVYAWLQPRSGERILDLGCGAGDWTARMAADGAIPTGIDLSEEMLRKARQKYPNLHFQQADACLYRTDEPFDAVFSHASLHWIKDAEAAVRTIRESLREGGRFVAEFAGKGNVSALTASIGQTMEEHGYAWNGRIPWYLPSIGEYAGLLEQHGFHVVSARHFDRPAPLKGTEGLRRWLDSFAAYFFPDVPAADRAALYQAIEIKAKPQLYREEQKQWIADTSRIRIAAIKITNC